MRRRTVIGTGAILALAAGCGVTRPTGDAVLGDRTDGAAPETESGSSAASESTQAPSRETPAEGGRRPSGRRLGVDDGAVPDGTTVFDAEVAGVARLEPDLLRAVRKAARDAAADGIDLVVNSGWRSPAYQEMLIRDAVKRYGSRREAARWVAPADTSLHVAGRAIDLGPRVATRWLAAYGSRYRLFQIYDNEPWHYELWTKGRPPRYVNPTEDPRLHG